MGHRFVETTQNYAQANDKQVQADFYKACEKLEGWTLLLDAAWKEDPQVKVLRDRIFLHGNSLRSCKIIFCNRRTCYFIVIACEGGRCSIDRGLYPVPISIVYETG